MTNKKTIPTPDNSGSSGEQSSDDSSLNLQEAKPLEGLLIEKTIKGLAANHAKSLGGEVTATFIAGVTSQIANDYQEIKQDYKNLLNKYDQLRDNLEAIKTHNAVLTERIRSEGRNRHLRNLCITFGTSLISLGIYLSRSEIDVYAFGAYGAGFVLLFFGWFSGPKESIK